MPIRAIELLKGVGLPADLLSTATGDWRLRADLGLSSAETLALQLRLEQLGCAEISLWDTYDHTLLELEDLIATATISTAPSGATGGARPAANKRNASQP